MSIEQRIYDELVTSQLSEYVQYSDNNQISSDLARGIGNLSFQYRGTIVTPSNPSLIGCTLRVDINEDDIEVVESNNVVYAYLNLDKVDFQIIKLDDNSITNIGSIRKNATKFRKINAKCWRDDSKLYLLKMNRNSGMIGRFDYNTGRFSNQIENYLTSTNIEIARDLITKDYLSIYFESQLSKIFSPIDAITETEINSKINNELVSRFVSSV